MCIYIYIYIYIYIHHKCPMSQCHVVSSPTRDGCGWLEWWPQDTPIRSIDRLHKESLNDEKGETRRDKETRRTGSGQHESLFLKDSWEVSNMSIELQWLLVSPCFSHLRPPTKSTKINKVHLEVFEVSELLPLGCWRVHEQLQSEQIQAPYLRALNTHHFTLGQSLPSLFGSVWSFLILLGVNAI